MNSHQNQRVVCFGELLWDVLPGGTVPGGAPLNVAYHLHQQGIPTSVITKTGADEAGKKLLEIFKEKGIDSRYFQVDPTYATGKVYAVQDANRDMTYDIVYPAAWDFIEWQAGFEAMVQQAAYFVFGSLAARSKVSAATLFRLLEMAPAKVLDINLRPPHFTQHLLKQLLQKADFLKMNFEELELVSGWFAGYATTEDRVKSLSEKFDLSDVVITKGKDGAMMYKDGVFHYHGGYPVRVADTVGSGDAFLAGMLASYLRNDTAPGALEWASQMGAYIATRTGGCPTYHPDDVKKTIPGS